MSPVDAAKARAAAAANQPVEEEVGEGEGLDDEFAALMAATVAAEIIRSVMKTMRTISKNMGDLGSICIYCILELSGAPGAKRRIWWMD